VCIAFGFGDFEVPFKIDLPAQHLASSFFRPSRIFPFAITIVDWSFVLLLLWRVRTSSGCIHEGHITHGREEMEFLMGASDGASVGFFAFTRLRVGETRRIIK
jgi:hypothetical protein